MAMPTLTFCYGSCSIFLRVLSVGFGLLQSFVAGQEWTDMWEIRILAFVNFSPSTQLFWSFSILCFQVMWTVVFYIGVLYLWSYLVLFWEEIWGSWLIYDLYLSLATWMTSGYIFKIYPIGFSSRLYVWYERMKGFKGDSEAFSLNN